MSQHLEFLRDLQRLLDEGVFTATYKYALLHSLADMAVERQPESDGSLRLAVSDIAEKVIQFYWQQTAPYRRSDEILHQNSGRQAAIVKHVAATRARYAGSLSDVRRDDQQWRHLKTKVSAVIRQMPLWKLQVIAGEEQEFLYRRAEYANGTIRMLPNAATCFRDMYVIVTHFIKGAWVARLESFGSNRDILGHQAGLQEFLFGSDRGSLDKYKPILIEHQRSRCFYCERPVQSGDLDHFIPWSRYPVDLGHNFVFAHASCNKRKSDFLAHEDHLAKWKDSIVDESGQLDGAFTDAGLAHDRSRSKHVAIWAYEQGEAAGAHVWIAGDQFRRLGPTWRKVFSIPAMEQPAKV